MPAPSRSPPTEGFVKVVAPGPVRIKAGGVLAKLERQCETKEKEVEDLKLEVVELTRDNNAKDEEIDTMKGLLDDTRTELEKEQERTKTLVSEFQVLKFAFHEKRASKKEVERITEQVRSSGFITTGKPAAQDANSTKSDNDDPLSWASHSIQTEIGELVSRLANSEARLALTEERCAKLEDTNKELEKQVASAMRHTQIVLKDKTKLADELKALKDAVRKSEAEDAQRRDFTCECSVR